MQLAAGYHARRLAILLHAAHLPLACMKTHTANGRRNEVAVQSPRGSEDTQRQLQRAPVLTTCLLARAEIATEGRYQQTDCSFFQVKAADA